MAPPATGAGAAAAAAPVPLDADASPLPEDGGNDLERSREGMGRADAPSAPRAPSRAPSLPPPRRREERSSAPPRPPAPPSLPRPRPAKPPPRPRPRPRPRLLSREFFFLLLTSPHSSSSGSPSWMRRMASAIFERSPLGVEGDQGTTRQAWRNKTNKQRGKQRRAPDVLVFDDEATELGVVGDGAPELLQQVVHVWIRPRHDAWQQQPKNKKRQKTAVSRSLWTPNTPL